MPTHVATAGTFTSTTLASADLNDLPGGWLGYEEITANQTGISTETDISGLSRNVTVGTSRRIKITGYARMLNDTVDDGCALLIYEGSTKLQTFTAYSTVTGLGVTCRVEVILTPSAGSHTYKLRADDVNGGTVQVSASSTGPAFILIEDIGPA